MGAKTLLSLEEFMALPEDGNKHELNQGELVVMPPPSSEHNIVLDNINTILSGYLRGKNLGRALAIEVVSPNDSAAALQKVKEFLTAEQRSLGCPPKHTLGTGR